MQTVSETELRRREPNIVGKGALFVESTAITDYPGITRQMNNLFTSLGGKILFGAEVPKINEQE